MKKTNALKLRQSLGTVLDMLKKEGQPVLIERNSKPAAVLISLEDYEKRFVDRDADNRRKELVEKLLATKVKMPKGKTSLDLIRESRR